jgi:hypothetical protein
MKKLILSLIVAVMAAALIYSCSKEIAESEVTQPYSDFDLQISNNIKGFIAGVSYQMENPDLKSDESFSIDSALWYLESTFNYCYGFPGEYYRQYEIDTFMLTLNLTSDNRVSMNELTAKYDIMLQEITDAYYNVAFEEKGLSLINLQEATITEDEVSFSVNVATGEKGIPPQLIISGPFVEDDDWWYGEMEGRCNEFLNDSDAAKQLMIAMNATLPNPIGSFHVINPTTINREGGKPNLRRETDPNPPDNLYDFYLFYGTEQISPVELCLYRNDMNIYYGFLRHLLLIKIRNEEFNSLYSLINVVDMVGRYNSISYPVQREYFHEGWYNYGIKVHYISEPDYPIQLD